MPSERSKRPPSARKTSPTKQAPAQPRRDWLAEIAAEKGLPREALVSVRGWMEEQFVGDEYAQLSHAGHDDTKIPLRRVFVDLPMTTQAGGFVSDDAVTTPFLGDLLAFPAQPLAELCRAPRPGREFLDFALVEEGPEERPTRSRNGRRRAGASIKGRPVAGAILIGGPGQGKSTLTQLLCQLHRAALLRGNPQLTTNVQDVLAPFEQPGRKGSIPIPERPLFPVRIVLPDASTWLARQETTDKTEQAPPVLLSFLASQESAKQSKCTAKTLQRWLCAMPCLLLLDALDEIGAESDRKRILSAVEELITMLVEAKSSAVVVATTRPQGYTGELKSIGVPLATRYLAPLSIEQALDYATKLLEQKIKGVDERKRALDNLREAAQESGTARLLQTPLQVTILASLVESTRPPNERWKLFESYLDVVYKREANRSTNAKTLLNERRGQILSIHARAALLLQVEAEAAGGASSRLSKERFTTIVMQVLEEDGIEGEALTELVTSLVRVAENRLVLLVEPEPGLFGFEIRSLQEFMAARALVVDQPEERVKERILQIAKAPLFRNVLLFIASRTFGGTSNLRSYLAKELCVLMENPSDPGAQATRMGAQLALEMLEEGSVLTAPKFAKELMRAATGLLDLPADDVHVRLVRVANRETEGELKHAIEQRLVAGANESSQPALACWLCLVEAANRGLGWGNRLVEQHWAGLKNPNDLLEACQMADVGASDWLVGKINEEPGKFSPWTIASACRTLIQEDRRVLDMSELREPMSTIVRELKVQVSIDYPKLGAHRGNSAAFQHAVFEKAGKLSPEWRLWAALFAFRDAPSATLLATTLEEIAEISPDPADWQEIARWAVWPLGACLATAQNTEQLKQIAEACWKQELGDTQDWTEAEKHWTPSSGSPLREALLPPNPQLPFTKETITHGKPLSTLAWARRASPRQREALQVSNKQWLHFAKVIDARDWIYEGALALSSALDVYLYDERTNALWLLELVRTAIQHDARENPADDAARLHTALATQTHQAPYAQQFILLLRAWLGELKTTELENLLPQLSASAAQSLLSASNVAHILARAKYDDPTRESLLLQWQKVQPQTLSCWDARRSFAELLETTRTRRSQLANIAIWTRLALPAPYPQSAGLSLSTTSLPTRPIVLSSLHLEHVRGIEDLKLEFTAPQPGKGQWIVVLGTNGSGKTTLLRSLCLALRDLGDAKIWPKGTWSTPWRAVGAKADPSIRVQLEGVGTYTTRLLNGNEKPEQTRAETRPGRLPLFAYGCRRGSAVGGEVTALDLKEDGGPEIATLFHEGAHLVHAETWLKEWDADALKNPKRSEPIYEAIQQALCRLLDVAKVFVKDRQVYIEEKTGRTILFAAQSDGYLTTAGWFLDLLARWIELCYKAKQDVKGDFMASMRGLVLLDEIDLHLHPKWQVETIRRVQKLLPEMSFLVTTHNPLTLVGAKPEEIHILKMVDGKLLAERGKTRPMFLSGGEIFMQYFEVEDIFPSAIGRDLNQYAFLAGYSMRSEADEKELEAIKERLANEDITPTGAIVPRQEPSEGNETKGKRARPRKAT